MSDQEEHVYKNLDLSPSNTFDFMDEGAPPALTGFSGASTAGFTGNATTNSPIRLPDGTGTFPKLTSFSGGGVPSSVQAEFAKFTEITTNPKLQTIRSMYYRTPNGEATITKGSATATLLPAVSGGKWVLSMGKTSGTIPIDDRTLKSGKNNLSVNDDKILMEQNLNNEENLVLSLVMDEGSPLSGAKISQNVIFADEAARPLYDGGISTTLALSAADINKADKLPVGKTSIVLNYNEQIAMLTQTTGSVAPLIKVIEFSDEAFTIPTGNSFQPEANEVLGNAIKIVIDGNDLNWGKYYRLELAGRAKDLASIPNEIKDVYYFSTIANKKPVLTFDDTIELAKDPNSSTDNPNKTQTLNMMENSVFYRGITDGILIENEGYIDPLNITYSLETPPLHTMAGQGEYAGLVGDASDFHLIPGSYKVTYTVTDLEDPTTSSDPTTRNYWVKGSGKVTFAGKEIDLFTAELTQSDILAAYSDKQANSLTTEQAIQNALEKKYTNTTSVNKLSAFRYNHLAAQENISIRFDTAGVPDSIFTDGADMALKLYLGDETEGRLFMLTAKVGEPVSPSR